MSDRKTKIKTLQGLRGIAALLILLSHYSFFKRATSLFPDGGVEIGQNTLMWIGAWGVSIFIILSGFVMYLSYGGSVESYDIRKKTISQYKRFLPLHLITMLLAIPLLLPIYVSKPINTAIKLVFNVAMLHTWIPHAGIYYSFNAVSWYLGLAVFFTVMTPLMIRVVNVIEHRGRHGILILIMTIFVLQGILACVADKVSLHESIGVAHWLTYVCPAVRFGDFVIGGAIGCIYKQRIVAAKNSKKNDLAFGLAVIACCLVTLLSNMYKSTLLSVFAWTIPCLLIVFCSAIAELEDGYAKEILTSKIIVSFGEISYELFLWHQLVMRCVLKAASAFIENDSWYLYLLSLMISVVLSYATHEVVVRCQNGRFR